MELTGSPTYSTTTYVFYTNDGTYAPFFGAIFEGGVLTPHPFAMGGEERGVKFHPILLASSDVAEEP